MDADRRAVAFSTMPVVTLLDADGRPVPLRPAAHRALVLLLRHRHTGITRKDLVAGIWPMTRPQHPDAALRTVLSRLRERLPADCLHQTDGRIRLAGLAGPGHVPPPFVGRDAEIHELTRLLDTHDAVLVTGSFGVGKSRLLAEFGGRQPWRREIVTVPTSLHALHARSGADDPVEALRRDLIAGEQLPTLVIADDIHRADPTVLEFLMALTDLGPVRLLAAAPTEDAVPGSITRHLRTSRWANLALGPLDGSAAAVLGRMVGARSDVAAAAGNPELICALARENVPGRGVVDAVRRRLSALPRDCADTLALVVLEGLLDWECIARLDALDSITLLEDHEFVVTDATGAHPISALVAGAVERSVTPARRRRFAERLHAAATTPVMRATWGLVVGEPVTSADLLAASAFHLRSGDPDAAERFAGSAWASDPTPDTGFTWAHALALGTRPGHEIRSRLAGIRATSPLDTPSIAVAAAVSTFLKDADPDGARRQLRTISEQNHPLGQVAAALLDTYTGRPTPRHPGTYCRRAPTRSRAAPHGPRGSSRPIWPETRTSPPGCRTPGESPRKGWRTRSSTRCAPAPCSRAATRTRRGGNSRSPRRRHHSATSACARGSRPSAPSCTSRTRTSPPRRLRPGGPPACSPGADTAATNASPGTGSR
ncbi:hypothetical protein [Gordonia sp. SMJS1]|uniref:hypothetical protein n=1 Tax=Gordonia sp. SMJS1 TaxID=3039400 RepID=UPI002458D9DE|nr:hypothetical protein [Gordonia sp. SMJS1]WGJ86764.1 hypothetical protein QAD21_06395 [Gordonia sp. SMJS1]